MTVVIPSVREIEFMKTCERCTNIIDITVRSGTCYNTDT